MARRARRGDRAAARVTRRPRREYAHGDGHRGRRLAGIAGRGQGALPRRPDGPRPAGNGRRGRAPFERRRGRCGHALVLRARRAADRARRRYRARRRCDPGRGRCRDRLRAPEQGARVRPAALAHACRGRRHDRRRAAAGARERPALPARPRRGRDLADRRQHRVQRRRAARVQVRRHRALGDRDRGSDPAGRDRADRRADSEGRLGLRRQEPARRVGGNARARHRGRGCGSSPRRSSSCP